MKLDDRYKVVWDGTKTYGRQLWTDEEIRRIAPRVPTSRERRAEKTQLNTPGNLVIFRLQKDSK